MDQFILIPYSIYQSQSTLPMHVELGLYPSFVDVVVVMNNKIRERLVIKHLNITEMYVSVDNITQKVAVDDILYYFRI